MEEEKDFEKRLLIHHKSQIFIRNYYKVTFANITSSREENAKKKKLNLQLEGSSYVGKGERLTNTAPRSPLPPKK